MNSLHSSVLLVGERLLVDDGGSAERTAVLALPDAPLPETDQMEEVLAGRDDGLRTLHVEVADAADVAVLGQLGLAGRGEGGGEFPDASSPGQVVGNTLTGQTADFDQVDEENARVLDWQVVEDKTLPNAGEYHGHSIEQFNTFKENTEVKLDFLRVGIFRGLVAVPGYEDVGGEVHQGLHSRHQADAEHGEIPGAVNQCSGV